MSPHHFARYAKNQPKEYQAFSNAMWNTFVSATHTIGLSKFFSFTPDEMAQTSITPSSATFKPGEVPGDFSE